MPYSNEANIKKALTNIDTGVFKLYRAAAKVYDVTHTTLLRRHHGVLITQYKAQIPRQTLSDTTKKRIKDLILWSERSRHALSFQQLREIAGKVSVANRRAPIVGI